MQRASADAGADEQERRRTGRTDSDSLLGWTADSAQHIILGRPIFPFAGGVVVYLRQSIRRKKQLQRSRATRPKSAAGAQEAKTRRETRGFSCRLPAASRCSHGRSPRHHPALQPPSHLLLPSAPRHPALHRLSAARFRGCCARASPPRRAPPLPTATSSGRSQTTAPGATTRTTARSKGGPRVSRLTRRPPGSRRRRSKNRTSGEVLVDLGFIPTQIHYFAASWSTL